MPNPIEQTIKTIIDDFCLKPVAIRNSQYGNEINYKICSDKCRGECRIFKSNDHLCLILLNVEIITDIEINFNNVNCVYLSYYRDLSAEYRIGENSVRLMNGMMYTNSGTINRGCTVFFADSQADGMILLIDQDKWLEQIWSNSESNIIKFSEINGLFMLPTIEPIIVQIERCPIRDNDELSHIFYNGKIHEIMSILTDAVLKKKQSSADYASIDRDDVSFIISVAEYIQNNLDQEIDVVMLTNMAKMSRAKLYYSFKYMIGMTMFEYRNALRGRKAKNLLTKTDIPINEIAENIGFSSASTFSRFFKDMYGITPYKYRKMDL